MNLSASGIKDFLRCSQSYQYRMEIPDEGIQTPEQAVGSAVHSIVQESWKEPSKETTDRFVKEYQVTDLKKLNICLDNYYSLYPNLLTEEDIVEENFRVHLYEDVYLVGKMDRIIPSKNMLIDWKTNTRSPSRIDNDIQFMIYYLAYKKLYNREPSVVMYASLFNNKNVYFKPDKFYIDILLNEIIPTLVYRRKNKIFTREGVFNGSCRNCNYLAKCWG